MRTMDLKRYFSECGYDWLSDKALIEGIAKLTKTRVRPEGKRSMYGVEQQFLIKAMVENLDAENAEPFGNRNILEIGTGRGTTCYVLSTLASVKKILTIDALAFSQKRETAINYVSAVLSNQDIYNYVPLKTKDKIEFVGGIKSSDWDPMPYKGVFDVVFIDGNHTDASVIKEDFYKAEFAAKPDGLILFDDYNCEWGPGVTQVVDEVVSTGKWDAQLIEFRGHLFEDVEKGRGPEKDQGLVILRRINA